MPKPISVDKLAPGQKLGPFVLLAPLGSGGSGRVWAAVRMGQLGFTKRMALKVMRQDRLASESARRRFDREALLGARMHHINLRAVHELGSHEGRPYMAMAWVDTSLTELLENAKDKRLDAPLVCWLGIQACAALTAAHRHVDHTGEPSPVVHGDVSPGNILLTKNGHVQLADLAADGEVAQRGQGEKRKGKRFFGNVGYASPESLKGLPLDGRADLFSLGCVLYEALCGCPAFEADDERSVMFQVLEQSPIRVRDKNPNVPEDVGRVVQRAMERRADDRFQTADDMREALRLCVASLSAFDLEEATTQLIDDVLGERIRLREEEMRAAYLRFSTSELEKTDTLPIGNAARPSDGKTLRNALGDMAETARDERAFVYGGVALGQQRRRRVLGASLVALVVFAGLIVMLALRERELLETRLSNEPGQPPPISAPEASESEAGQQTSSRPDPAQLTTEETPAPTAPPAPNPTAPLPTGHVPEQATKQPKPGARTGKTAGTEKRSAPATEQSVPPSDKPSFTHFPPNPYDSSQRKGDAVPARDIESESADQFGGAPRAKPSILPADPN